MAKRDDLAQIIGGCKAELTDIFLTFALELGKQDIRWQEVKNQTL